jgi:hypothetical protein
VWGLLMLAAKVLAAHCARMKHGGQLTGHPRWPHDATWRNTGEPARSLVLAGEPLSGRTGNGMSSVDKPPIVGHGTFDAE